MEDFKPNLPDRNGGGFAQKLSVCIDPTVRAVIEAVNELRVGKAAGIHSDIHLDQWCTDDGGRCSAGTQEETY